MNAIPLLVTDSRLANPIAFALESRSLIACACVNDRLLQQQNKVQERDKWHDIHTARRCLYENSGTPAGAATRSYLCPRRLHPWQKLVNAFQSVQNYRFFHASSRMTCRNVPVSPSVLRRGSRRSASGDFTSRVGLPDLDCAWDGVDPHSPRISSSLSHGRLC
jgi:hypothetical protein